MKTLLVSLLLLTACGSDESSTTTTATTPTTTTPTTKQSYSSAKSLVGNWYYEINSECAWVMTFSETQFVSQLVCAESPTLFYSEVSAGSYRNNGSSVTYYPDKSSCPYIYESYESAYSFAANGNLTMKEGDSFITYVKFDETDSSSSSVVRTGCYDENGNFTFAEVK